jgi:hypothetical protein
MPRRRFKLQKGMILIVTRTLDNETPMLVAWGWSYKDVWDHWMENPEREWDMAFVEGFEVPTDNGIREILQVHKLVKPLPPDRYARKLARALHSETR